jgi:hypothetical protein
MKDYLEEEFRSQSSRAWFMDIFHFDYKCQHAGTQQWAGFS